MLTLRGVVIFVLGLSFLIFVALFGRLPALRGTPISFLYRILWIKIPRVLRRVDSALTGGSGGRVANEFWEYLLYKNHPLIMVIYLVILTGSAALFLSATLTTMPTTRLIPLLILLALPYIFTYLCARSTASTITSANSAHQHTYPHDHIIFHRDNICRTCKIPKPARSKHCSLCGRCVARMDHHCHWITNCVGHANYMSFLFLLVSLHVLLVYGAYLAYELISTRLQLDLMRGARDGSHGTHHPSSPVAVGNVDADIAVTATASSYSLLNALSSSIRPRLKTLNRGLKLGGLRIGGVGLLCTLTAPLPAFMFGYHMYLLWAGMTTNESDKWEQLREDMRDGIVYRGVLRLQPEQDTIESESKRFGGHGQDITHTHRDANPRYQTSYSRNNNNNNNNNDENTNKDNKSKTWPHHSHYMVLRIDSDQQDYSRTLSLDPSVPLTSTYSSSATPSASAIPQHIAHRFSNAVDPASWQRVWHLGDVENIYDVGFWAAMGDVWRGWDVLNGAEVGSKDRLVELNGRDGEGGTTA